MSPSVGNHAHVHLILGAPALEGDLAVGQGEQRVVRAHANIGSGAVLGATLTDNDVTGEHLLTAERLYAESLTVRVAAISGAAARFFMCHVSAPQSADVDTVNLYFSELLPMVFHTQVMLAAPEFDHAYLISLTVTLHCR